MRSTQFGCGEGCLSWSDWPSKLASGSGFVGVTILIVPSQKLLHRFRTTIAVLFGDGISLTEPLYHIASPPLPGPVLLVALDYNLEQPTPFSILSERMYQLRVRHEIVR